MGLRTIEDQIQYGVAFYMFGLAVSQLFYGYLSEGIGRRLPIIWGTIVLFFGSAICWFALGIEAFIAGCLIQGLGAGAACALWRSVFRDVFNGAELAKYGSYAAIIVTFVVPGMPVLGGYLLNFFGWRINFLFMMVYALVVIFLLIFGFKETSQHHHPERFNYKFIFSAFRELLSSRIFMGYSLAVLLSYGAYFAWFVSGSVLLIKVMGISPVVFGWITLVGIGCATIFASYINGLFVGHFGTHFMLRIGWAIMIVSGVLMLLGKFMFGINIIAIVVPTILFYIGSALIWPNSFAEAFIPFGKIAGYAGALYGFLQIVGGAVASGLIAYMPNGDQSAMALIFIVAPLLAWVLFEWIVRPSYK